MNRQSLSTLSLYSDLSLIIGLGWVGRIKVKDWDQVTYNQTIEHALKKKAKQTTKQRPNQDDRICQNIYNIERHLEDNFRTRLPLYPSKPSLPQANHQLKECTTCQLSKYLLPINLCKLEHEPISSYFSYIVNFLKNIQLQPEAPLWSVNFVSIYQTTILL